jgi:hypothetical protein
VAQALGIVHVFVSGEPPKHGLPQQTDQHMTAVLPGTCVGEQVTRHGAEAEGIIKFAIGQQSGIRGNSRAAKLEHQASVEIWPERTVD